MTEIPDVRYARSGDVAIAYQVLGEGPVDLVFSPFIGNMRYAWEHPLGVRFYERLASFSRLILFDKRGMGLSDRPRALTLETQMDDIRAVLDAVGSERAAVLGAGQGSQLTALFAATYPERTRALVLYHPEASPAGPVLAPARSPAYVRERWGSRERCDELTGMLFPSMAGDEGLRRWYADYLRFAASPGAAAEFFRMFNDTDISDVLPTIRVPTLVVYRAQMREPALRVAALIPGARAVQVGGEDVSPFADAAVPSEVERFLSSSEEAPVPDSVLTTVLFTDIVASTERAAALGDRSCAICSRATMRPCDASSLVSAARSSIPRATASSQGSTAQHARSAARRRSSPTPATSTWTCAPGCTQANASCTKASWPGSRSASARAWPERPVRARCSSRAR